jgi:PAS domain S-box-containing protein
VLDSLREQTGRISLAKYESERRLRAIDQLASYFDAGSDGVVVLDADGKVLFTNRAAESITGWARDGLRGHPLNDLVPEPQRDGLVEVIHRVLAGTNLEAFDLDITTTSGETICVSVTTSTVLTEHGAAILTFRDVTAERALETELRKTKEFLEKLIDSTVDAIVAADIEGNVILFNPGAERLYGWRAEDVIGLVAVEKLYPDGVARQIMRMLRSPSYGGVGRLEQTRREIITKDGELVPVNMTASTIYEDGREVATVGILSDLRDRIRIEQRLLQAQEKLLITEKQAVVAELAGAAAHELNQPLTSVLLTIELIQKRMKDDDPHARSLATLYREAVRMAEIVKKIGKITRYETKAYVGSANILDLEKSSEIKE